MTVRQTETRHSTSAVAMLLGVVAFAAGCTGDSPFSPGQKLENSRIQLASPQLSFSALGDSAAIQVQGVNASSVSWSVSDPNVASVATSGVVRAVSDGTTYVVGRLGRWTDSTQVTVAPQPTSLVIQPQLDTIASVGGTVRLTVNFYDRNGNQVKSQSVAWSSLDPDVASVANGRVTALQPGVARIMAATSTLADTATALVLQDVYKVSLTPTSAATFVGQTVAFSAVALDSKGNVISSVPISWSSSNPAVAAVSNGMVTGVSAGSAQITATAGAKSATSNVQVKAVPVSAVVVSPSSGTATVGGAVQYTAQTLDASGNTLTNRSIAWSSSNTSVATVTAAGLVTAVSVGQTNITATSEGVSGQAAFTASASSGAPVAATPVATVVVAPSSNSIQIGSAVQLSATEKDSSGNVLTGRVVTWSSSAPAIASVSSSGLVTAVAAGQATINAVSENVVGSAAVSVPSPSTAPVASVTVAPGASTLQIGSSAQLSVTAKDANGNVLTGRTVTWSSLATSIASVSATGLVTALATGSATVDATVDGVVGAAAISVPTSGTISGSVLATDFTGVSVSYTDGQLKQNGANIGLYYGQWSNTAYGQAVQVVDDPTGAGQGKVLSMHYVRNGVTITSQDQNRAIYTGQSLGLGKDFVASGRLYLPRPASPMDDASAARKLFYYTGDYGIMIVGLWGGSLMQPFYYDYSSGSQVVIAPYIQIPNIYDAWHTVRLEIKTNSTPTTADGAIRLWLDGTLVHERTGVILLPDTTHPMQDFGIGYQTQRLSTDVFDEYRYWDDIQITVN